MRFSTEEDVTFEGCKYDVQNTEIIADINGKYENSMDDCNNTANIMAILSYILMIIGTVGIVDTFLDHFEFSLIFFLLYIVSGVFAIAIRIKFPENMLGKMLIKDFIIGLVAFGILAFVLIKVNSCMNSCNNFLDGCARMG